MSAMCAKLTANMSHQQCRDWVSPGIDYIKVCPDLPVRPTEQPRASLMRSGGGIRDGFKKE